jgi:hypothetical protein
VFFVLVLDTADFKQALPPLKSRWVSIRRPLGAVGHMLYEVKKPKESDSDDSDRPRI